ncbi:hypothetical protein OAR43_02460 [Gammaproteobacteria bacterium]|nr:hypothetical protein [Gammaproteobacteria bacterium]MDC3279937.1 hypothetical protein [Gammaproteobacteria bacterium]
MPKRNSRTNLRAQLAAFLILATPFSALSLGGCSSPSATAGADRACCRGLVPQCAACEAGMTLENWLKETCPNGETDAYYNGWDASSNKPEWICEPIDVE